jgi:uncharacterized protein (TIGR03437 family)
LINSWMNLRFGRLVVRSAALLWLAALGFTPLFAQPSAILADGSGPWRDAQWAFTVSQFSGLLTDAGYSVKTVAPQDLPSALSNPNTLLAIPSLESLPFDTFTAIATFVNSGGGLMASGGAPFSDPLYLAPNGQYLDAAAYLQAVGSAPPQGPFTPPSIPTISPPSTEQYTTSSGLQMPVPRGRGLFSSSFSASGRYRVIGDLLTPAATLYFNTVINFSTVAANRSFVVWLPWPQLFDPLRAQLVAALEGAPSRVSFQTAGTDQIAWLPGETITGTAIIVNGASTPVQVTLKWSISGASGVTVQPAQALSLSPGEQINTQLNFPVLANGDYTLNFRLMIGGQQVDSLDSPLRVLDPTLSRQPDQKIRVVNGAFSTAGGSHVFLRGVNYWPRFIAGQNVGEFNGQSWLESSQYDPDVVEADLTEIAALHFNLVNIQFSDYESGWAQEGRALMDFLERCRNHGIWVQVALRTTLLNGAYTGQMNPTLDSYLQAAYLPGNDRVLAYELLWEPMVGTHDMGGQGGFVNGSIVYNTGRMVLDPDWRAWIADQYGSQANAAQIWGVAAPLDGNGNVTNPSDDQIENDGPWRVMVAAYRRFLDDYLGRNLGAIARQIRRTDPDTLLTYRNWTTMTSVHNSDTGYDIGTAAAHLDYFSPERYAPVLPWPDDRPYGLITAYSRYRTGGKPVVWAEYGADIGANGGTGASQSAQGAICDTMMRQIADDGSNGASVWWWPGGYGPLDGTDFGIVDPGGNPRPCATILSQWNAMYAASAPDLASYPPTTLMVDRDADSRGSYGLFLNNQASYTQARQAGQSVVLADHGTGTDTSSMPLIQVGNAAYSGTGPLKYVNGEFAGVHVVCPSLDVTVENGSTVAIPSGAICQLTPTLVNTGEAQWLPASAASRGVTLHTSAGDVPLATELGSLQRTAMGPLAITMGQSASALTGQLKVLGVGNFGEILNLTLAVDSSTTGSCAMSLSSTGPISIPAAGATGTINVKAATGCSWAASASEPWLSLGSASGSGNGAVTYTVLANYGPVRTTVIQVAEHPFTVTQDGVIETNVPPPALALSSANLSFGSQTIGTPGTAQPVQLTNSGAAALNLSAVTIGGLNQGDFAETNNCGTALAAAANCTINVIFTPTSAGIRTASLFVAGDINGGTQAVVLSGTGVATGPLPAIQAIVDSWGYSAGLAPGLWVTIGGTNLAGPPETWNLTGVNPDGVQTLPVTVGDTSVTFNGTPSPLLYVSETQINALVPASVANGNVQVVAQVNGVNSVPFTIAAKAVQPAVYAPPSADGSTFFVTAALAGTATLVGNSATDPRVSRPVYPGDTLDLYMIGLGATSDPADFITDKLFSGAFPLSATVTASVGGEAAKVLFAGLTSPGLYLVRIVVPSDLPAGAQPLQVSAGGIQTRPSLVLQMATVPMN